MLGFGALGEFPLADFGTPPPPVAVFLPAVNLALAIKTGAVAAGKAFGAPTAHLTWTSIVAGTLTGRLVGLPPAPLAFGAPLPKPLPGKLIGLPPFRIGFLALDPNSQTGRIISLTDTVLVVGDVGTLAGSALGEFALLEGDPIVATFEIPARLFLDVKTAAIRTGKNIPVPVVEIAFATPPPEADSRLRPIRINAIAS